MALTCQGQALGAPPADVQCLLSSERCALALYFDAQRVEACLRAQDEWPRLWRLASAPP